MESSWRESALRWRRFEEWESARARDAKRDYGQTLAWMADAWEIAARRSRWWSSHASAEEHWELLAEIQRRLRRAGISP